MGVIGRFSITEFDVCLFVVTEMKFIDVILLRKGSECQAHIFVIVDKTWEIEERENFHETRENLN